MHVGACGDELMKNNLGFLADALRVFAIGHRPSAIGY
jgi:hypothetical protein